MSRKFIQLEVGQGFLFEGASYVKSSPLMARNEATGHERFMPRSAVVQTQGDLMPAPTAPTHTLPAAEVQRAWQQFHKRCAASVAALASHVDPQVSEALQREFAAARAAFEQALGLGGEM